jgi:hypothetical protein
MWDILRAFKYFTRRNKYLTHLFGLADQIHLPVILQHPEVKRRPIMWNDLTLSSCSGGTQAHGVPLLPATRPGFEELDCRGRSSL